MSTALVTGGSRGIGLEVCRQLGRSGFDVVLTARHLEPARTAAAGIDTGRVVPLRLDVSDAGSVAGLPDALRENGIQTLDVVVSNAAAFPDWSATVGTADLADVELAWQTNVLGPWRLIRALHPLLSRSTTARVVCVTSASGSHGDTEFGLGTGPGMAPYAITKAAANALVRKLAAENPAMLVNAVDPGLTATAPGMAEMGARPVEEGAASVVWAATLPADGPRGGFFRDGRPLPW